MKKIIMYAGMMIALLTAGNFAQAQHKKMSSQAKGAIIGGAGGAVAGGIIGHGVKGAVIGGAIGAGGGYIIGNEHRRHLAKKRHEAAVARQNAKYAAYYREHHRHYAND